MLHRNCVPKSVYDSLLAQFNDLFDKYHQLKQGGAVLPPATIKHVSPAAVERMRLHDESINRMAKELEAGGIPRAEAEREAKRLRSEAFGTDVLPG